MPPVCLTVTDMWKVACDILFYASYDINISVKIFGLLLTTSSYFSLILLLLQ
jgi:hypothetical protein